VKAGLLVPLVNADPLGRFMKDWVVWAERVTVRRLREDVEWALALEETDPLAFRQSGGLPPESREIGAPRREPGVDAAPQLEREIGAPPREATEETCSVFGPADVVKLFRAVLCAFHHLRGVHAARLRCVGRAPDGLTWQMGIRPGAAPLVAYRSGDLQVRPS
jgi:hypothetical protein